MNEVLTLGQIEKQTDDAVWLNIRVHGGRYVCWSEAEDEEYRELMGIESDHSVPQIQIRRWGSPLRTAHNRKSLRKFSKLGEIPQQLQDKLHREAVAECILVDWRHIANEEGDEAEYSPEIGVDAFKADIDFLEAVVAASLEADHFRSKAIAEDADALGN